MNKYTTAHSNGARTAEELVVTVAELIDTQTRKIVGPYARPLDRWHFDDTARRISLAGSRHLYGIGTSEGRIEVEADSRAQARRVAELFGFVVRDVNMEG